MPGGRPGHSVRQGPICLCRAFTPNQVKPITEFLSNEDNVKLLKQDKAQNMAFLQKEFGIGARAGRTLGGRGGRCMVAPGPARVGVWHQAAAC